MSGAGFWGRVPHHLKRRREKWTHKGIHPKPLPLTSQEVGTPNCSLLLWKLPLHPYSSLPASQGWLFPSRLCLYSAATCLLSHHGLGRSDRLLTIYGVRLEAGQTFIGSKCGGVQSMTTPHTHTHTSTTTTMIELLFSSGGRHQNCTFAHTDYSQQ